MITEADTCRRYVLPKLDAAGWNSPPHSFTEQRTFTDGRIFVTGRPRRGRQKRADYLLRYADEFPIAVVEAKPAYRTAADGLQQAKEYAEILDLKFAYATNGRRIVEYDFLAGRESDLVEFPSPMELWDRLIAAGEVDASSVNTVLQPFHHFSTYQPRYYQEIAVNRSVRAILAGKRRVLLTMATGTGKTIVAFQLCWKLWQSRWNSDGTYRRPRILYLADRNVLIDDPKDKTFAPFGDARVRLEGGALTKSREIYFALYQTLAGETQAYREYDPSFFDLIIVDECHRGSARANSEWRDILRYFAPAFQLGMTATPLRSESRDTYAYFGNPVYEYSLRQGIEDGFLAPYRLHRIVMDVDAVGWRPTPGEVDRYGRSIPDGLYGTRDFERTVALKARTTAIAESLSAFMASTDRYAKTIVFCVDQEHAADMRAALNNANADLARRNPNYVVRITSDEGGPGRAALGDFQEPDNRFPVIATTSQLLTTGVDVPTCTNVVIARLVGSLAEFKQIIGRGTRVRDDYGKLFFNIVDYTGSAAAQFADPDFDGSPSLLSEAEIDSSGATVAQIPPVSNEPPADLPTGQDSLADDSEGGVRKFYVDGGAVEIAAQVVYQLASDGSRLRVIRYDDYSGERVRRLYASAVELHRHWLDASLRDEILAQLADVGVDLDSLAEFVAVPEADPFDLLCFVAFAAPIRSRRERAAAARSRASQEFAAYSREARTVLMELLDRYADNGPGELRLPEAIKTPPLEAYGNVAEISALFGGPERLRDAVAQLQDFIYAA